MMLHLNGHIAWRGTVFRACICIAATGWISTDIVRLCACIVATAVGTAVGTLAKPHSFIRQGTEQKKEEGLILTL